MIMLLVNFSWSNGTIKIYNHFSMTSDSMILGDGMSWFVLMSASLSLLFQLNYLYRHLTLWGPPFG